MTDETTAAAPSAEPSKAGPEFAVQRIYLKDLSFETPMGAAAFQKQWQPKVNQDLNTKSGKVADDVYEVALRLTITVTDGENTIYLIEVEQAGLFTIKGLESQQLTHVINTTCPSMLFPYAREVIDNVLTKGSFPALMLPPINFEALFASAVKQAEENAAEEANKEGTTH
ncbi:MAG: protein-export chaperone SecB [Porticoccaceae bacterium]|nr:protein-export chaperone SecB [Porticoccaceae bacterium]MDG1475015.1 protein-export chaperone SecB [Porticoccaceae bacterium]